MPKKTIEKEKIRLVLSDIKRGMKPGEIKEKYCISYHMIKNIKKKYGYDKGSKKTKLINQRKENTTREYNKKNESELISDIANGMETHSIKEKYGFSQSYLTRFKRRNNLSRKSIINRIDIEGFKDDYQNRLSYKKIMEKYKITKNNIHDILQKTQIKRKETEKIRKCRYNLTRNITKNDIEKCMEKRMNIREMAQFLHCSVSRLSNLRKAYGIHKRIKRA